MLDKVLQKSCTFVWKRQVKIKFGVPTAETRHVTQHMKVPNEFLFKSNSR